MIKFNKAGFLIASFILSTLTACGSMKSHLPDKERDYQFSAEIPPLTIPNDLKKTTPKPRVVTPDINETEEVKVLGEMVDSDSVVKQPKPSSSKNGDDPAEEIILDRGETRVDFVIFDGGATRLRINEDFAPSWRLVAKALSRNRIEIVSRNQAAGELIVQYDPNETDFKDETVWDEILFVFAEDHSQEKEYRIKIMEYNNNTEVIVLDSENTPLSDGVGLHLLKLLFSTIHTDLTSAK